VHKLKIEWADRFQILAFEQIATVFFQDILGMEYSAILITDESALSDFAGCGDSCSDFPSDLKDYALPRAELYNPWRKWVAKKISERYAIDIPEAGMIFLVDLFRRIETARCTKVH
jgi:hypothetical protein